MPERISLNKHYDGTVVLGANGVVANFELYDKYDESPDIIGFLRFDGCVNWGSNDCYAHFCGRESLDDFYDAFKKLMAIGSKLLSKPNLKPEWAEKEWGSKDDC